MRYSCELRVPPDAWPPLRPASDANSRSCENDLFSAGTLRPPLLAISRCRSSSIDAKPRFEVELPFAMNCLLPSLRLGQPRSDSMVPAKAGFFGGRSIGRTGKLIRSLAVARGRTDALVMVLLRSLFLTIARARAFGAPPARAISAMLISKMFAD